MSDRTGLVAEWEPRILSIIRIIVGLMFMEHGLASSSASRLCQVSQERSICSGSPGSSKPPAGSLLRLVCSPA